MPFNLYAKLKSKHLFFRVNAEHGDLAERKNADALMAAWIGSKHKTSDRYGRFYFIVEVKGNEEQEIAAVTRELVINSSNINSSNTPYTYLELDRGAL